jgi:hypothetical protein
MDTKSGIARMLAMHHSKASEMLERITDRSRAWTETLPIEYFILGNLVTAFSSPLKLGHSGRGAWPSCTTCGSLPVAEFKAIER